MVSRDKTASKAPVDKHAGHNLKMFAQKFWISLFLTVPVVLINFEFVKIANDQYLAALFASVVFFYGGWIFLTSALRELKARSPGMMTLIALAIISAYSYSIYSILSNKGENLFWELTTLITVMLAGHYIEMKSVQSAQGALKELSKLLPDKAEIKHGKAFMIMPLDQIKIGDTVLVRPGSRVPADGQVISGQSQVNESMITGESKPVDKKIGSAVIAGTINGSGSLEIKINKIGEQTFLSGVMRLVQQAQQSKSKLQLLSDKAAYYLTLLAISSAIITLVSWLSLKSSPDFAIERMVAVLVIACPHALGLAIPLVAAISTSMAARSGFLIRDRTALELAKDINVVLFDKTGTLTQGDFSVIEITGEKTLQIAASVESHSEHPIAKAIVEKAKQKKIKLLEINDFKALIGKGVEANIGQEKIQILASTKNKNGLTTVDVISHKKLIGTIYLGDKIREESKTAIGQLKNMGITVAMITGDSQDVAQSVAKQLGIKEYFARVLPEQKHEKVKKLQVGGKKVAMVGDGINDAPALVQADLGVAIGAGTNVAIESAGIILVRNNPQDIVSLINLSQSTYRKMIQNLFWATGYNIVALPLAAGVLASQNIILQPAVSALLMSVSTVIVALNALTLKKQKL